jgi:[DsrC]-trisulfide reductase subunit J
VSILRFLAILLILPGLIFAPVAAQETSSLYPEVPKATGEPHPEGNEFWRINHMKLLLHDRDDTLRLGDRKIQASLKGCVVCHAVKGDDGQPVGAEDERYFCQVCHAYTAVKIDCFTCHASKPDEADIQALLAPGEPDIAKLAAYLEGIDQTAALPQSEPQGIGQ